MESIEVISCQLIAASGTAKSNYIEAIEYGKKGDFEKAEELIKEGDKIYLQGHESHAKLIQLSTNEQIDIPLLLIHAEDQMMNCETMKIFAVETLYLLKENKKLMSMVGGC